MRGTKVLFLFCMTSAYGFSQTYLSANFDQLAGPSGCTGNHAPLKLPGMTISGGQVLQYADPYQTYNNVYATMSTCAGEQAAITITFEGPVSGLNLVAGNNWNGGESLLVTDDGGGSQNIPLGLFNNGQTIFFTDNNIHT